MPNLFLYGIQCITLLKNIFILHGAGVGGGSLVYANTLLVPPDKAFEDKRWIGGGWKERLLPFYNTAKTMLGATRAPYLGETDHILKQSASRLGREDSFKRVMEYCNVSDYEMWNWEESLNGYLDLNRLKNKIKDECEINNYENVVTHNSYGEYGHIQHQQLNEIMTECLYEGLVDKFWVYDLNPLGLEYRNQNTNQIQT